MESKAEEQTIPTPQQAAAKGKAKAKGDSGFKENPYIYLASDDPILQSCMYVYSSSRYDAQLKNIGRTRLNLNAGGRGMDASFRVLGEGLPVVLPYIRPETITDCDIGILKTLLSVYYPLCGTFPEPFKSAIEARGECFCFLVV
jgi:multisite-specific tRNA:(cytosine-C5)-methyltransferase